MSFDAEIPEALRGILPSRQRMHGDNLSEQSHQSSKDLDMELNDSSLIGILN